MQINPYIYLATFVLFYSHSYAGNEAIRDNISAKQQELIKNLNDPNYRFKINGYSDEKKDSIEQQLNSIPPSNLSEEGLKLKNSEIQKDPNGTFGIIEKGSSAERVVNKHNEVEEFLTKSEDILKDPLSEITNLTSQECKEIQNKPKQHSYYKRTYFENHSETINEIKSCEAPINQFECTKTLQFQCKEIGYCDYGGIQKGTFVTGDTQLQYENGHMLIGTVADNNWGGYCQEYNRDIEFKIKNLNLLKEFNLYEIGFDDYVHIFVNDIPVYIGPYGGDKLQVIEEEINQYNYRNTKLKKPYPLGAKIKFVNNGHTNFGCDLKTNWKTGINLPSINIDLKPYLKEGVNKISAKVLVTGGGEFWMRIAAKQYCCKSDDSDNDKWSIQCEAANDK